MTGQTQRIAAALQQAARVSANEDVDDAQTVVVAFLRAFAADRECVCDLDELADDVEGVGDE